MNEDKIAVRIRTSKGNPLLGVLVDDGQGYLSDMLRPLLHSGLVLIIKEATESDFREVKKLGLGYSLRPAQEAIDEEQ